ncbi:hypothetical protein [Nocardia asiatica]|uniref:hypothetical protein n=1 Tax=Nocardia asiatica TaxID=209252 RepID=UPI00030F8DCE|nr:hypothetical protein [Nocardia asiatica]
MGITCDFRAEITIPAPTEDTDPLRIAASRFHQDGVLDDPLTGADPDTLLRAVIEAMKDAMSDLYWNSNVEVHGTRNADGTITVTAKGQCEGSQLEPGFTGLAVAGATGTIHCNADDSYGPESMEITEWA